MAVEANTDLIEAALMYMNKTADEQTIAEELELIDQDYLDSDATESFKTLYQTILEAKDRLWQRAITIQVMKLSEQKNMILQSRIWRKHSNMMPPMERRCIIWRSPITEAETQTRL